MRAIGLYLCLGFFRRNTTGSSPAPPGGPSMDFSLSSNSMYVGVISSFVG